MTSTDQTPDPVVDPVPGQLDQLNLDPAGPDDDSPVDIVEATSPVQLASSVKLTPGVSADRATREAVYDTGLQRFVDQVPDGAKVTKTGRYQLRRV